MKRPGVPLRRPGALPSAPYLAGVARAIRDRGGEIFEHSAADEFCDDPRRVTVNGYAITCDDVVIATHNPLVGIAGMTSATLFQTKLALYTSYVSAAASRKDACPTRCSGIRPIRTTTCGSSRTRPRRRDLRRRGSQDRAGRRYRRRAIERLEARLRTSVAGTSRSRIAGPVR